MVHLYVVLRHQEYAVFADLKKGVGFNSNKCFWESTDKYISLVLCPLLKYCIEEDTAS